MFARGIVILRPEFAPADGFLPNTLPHLTTKTAGAVPEEFFWGNFAAGFLKNN